MGHAWCALYSSILVRARADFTGGPTAALQARWETIQQNARRTQVHAEQAHKKSALQGGFQLLFKLDSHTLAGGLQPCQAEACQVGEYEKRSQIERDPNADPVPGASAQLCFPGTLQLWSSKGRCSPHILGPCFHLLGSSTAIDRYRPHPAPQHAHMQRQYHITGQGNGSTNRPHRSV